MPKVKVIFWDLISRRQIHFYERFKILNDTATWQGA